MRLGTEARLSALTNAERARRWLLVADDPRWDDSGLSGAERGRVKLRRVAWLAELRERGELLDTAAAVLALGVRAELAERGWDHQWPAAPETAVSGRWPGARSSGWPERIGANLPASLVEQVRAACWHSSPIAELRAFRDAFPGLLTGRRLREYNELSARVVTPGDIWRAGYQRVLWPDQGDAETR
ncbi:hypothetical protein [Actinomadura montaniterrae]|uniref:Uncharacterized protein n=1 Tax=Actinomadura montaniterrae TaxID=1803903 RepID=A0A6L3VXE1_9ACTN|nr:hypothetical protein [Actinomadura montaniterrae]KAB2376996.1 hypothetical protein F9B16_24490 [Actinomadura montaniterrae]